MRRTWKSAKNAPDNIRRIEIRYAEGRTCEGYYYQGYYYQQYTDKRLLRVEKWREVAK